MVRKQEQDASKASRFVHIPRWAWISLGVGVSIIVTAIALDTSQSSDSIKVLKSVLLGIGCGVSVSMLAVILDTFIQDLWPSQEVRKTCANLWKEDHLAQIDRSLSNRDPTGALEVLYAPNDLLANFDSAEILHAIKNMHEGAFLATVVLWTQEMIDEELMRPKNEMCTSELQRKIFMYRELLAKKIEYSHIIAARRYRIKHADLECFLDGDEGQREGSPLKSLVELVQNISSDIGQGWSVDVEFYSSEDRHNPFLDYALLFGDQSPNKPQQLMPRVAYITHPRRTLLEKKDYVGVVVSDADLVIRLMEDRFRVEHGIKDGSLFISDAGKFIENMLTSVVSQSELLSEYQDALDCINECIGVTS